METFLNGILGDYLSKIEPGIQDSSLPLVKWLKIFSVF